MTRPRYRRITIVGVGLIGGSVGKAVRRRSLAEEVVGVVRSEARAKQVLECGCVDSATTGLADGCRGASVVVVATPVSAVAPTVLRAAAEAPNALITDGGSTKAQIVADVGRAAPRFVGAHPLAGDHRTGPEAARHDLFHGAATVLTPADGGDPGVISEARAFWEALGCQVVELTPERHDELLAITSHVPHVAAAAVAATTPSDALRLAASGWADTTRVAAGAADLWRDILLANRVAVSGGLRRLAAELDAYATALDRGDADTIQRLLTEGKRRRDALGS